MTARELIAELEKVQNQDAEVSCEIMYGDDMAGSIPVNCVTETEDHKHVILGYWPRQVLR